jgi:hypothetical protein
MKRPRRGSGSIRFILMSLVTLYVTLGVYAELTLNSFLGLPGIAKDVEIKGSFAYVSTDSGLAAVDVSDPANPILKDFIQMFGRGNELSLYGNMAFVTAGQARMAAHIVDISNSGILGRRAFMDDSGGYVWGIASREKPGSSALTAVASLSGLSIFDIPPSYLLPDTCCFGVKPLSRFSPYRWIKKPLDSLAGCDSCLYGSRLIKTDDVVLDGTFAYVLYYDYNIYNVNFLCLKKVDLTDPSNPRCVDSLDLYSFGCALAVSEGYAYVAHTGNQWNPAPEMDIIDVRTIPMTVRSSIRLPGPGEDVVIAGKLAYIACGSSGLSVVDVSDPQRPVQVDSFPFAPLGSPVPLTANGIAPADTMVYVAAGEGGVLVLKKNPTSISNRQSLQKADDIDFRIAMNSGMLIIRFPADFIGNASVEMYTLNGRMMLQQPLGKIQNGTARVRCVNRMNRPLMAGMYFLRLKKEEKNVVFEKPFILQ